MLPPQAGGFEPSGSGFTTGQNGNGNVGTLVPVTTDLPALPSYGWPPVSPGRPAGLDAAPTVPALLNAFRRRWPLAVGLGLLVGLILAVVIYFVAPNSQEVTASLLVRRQMQDLMSTSYKGNDVNEFLVFKQTLINRLKSPFVINRALAQPGIADLGIVRSQVDPVTWLNTTLRTFYPGDAEYLLVSLTTENPKESAQLVNAIVDSLVNEYTNEQRQEKVGRRTDLNNAYVKIQTELETKRRTFNELSKTSGVANPEAGTLQTSILMGQIQDLKLEMRNYNALIIKANQDIIELRNTIDNFSKTTVGDQIINTAIDRDPEILMLNKQLGDAMLKFSDIKKVLPEGEEDNPRLLQAQAEIDDYRERLMSRRQVLRPQILKDMTSTDSSLGLYEGQLKATETLRTSYEERYKSLNIELKELIRKATELGVSSSDLATLASSITGLVGTSDSLSRDLRNLDIELAAIQPRINKIDPAVALPGSSAMMRNIMVAFSGMFGLALAAFAVTFWEFQHRKISSQTDVSDGLGLRVVGAVPAISGRERKKMLAGGEGGVNVIAESINGIRAMLLHGTASENSPRVVMITSATSGETKTTLASQLAASLARAGRRTLLVDGSVRAPSLQRIFSMPLEPGLCELLRNESDLMDVVRPTRTDGLWMISAGHCDRNALEALARDSIQEMFNKLRPDFDFIIIDAGPAVGIADALLLGQLADTTILAIRRDISQMPKVYEAYDRLTAVGISVMGAVISGVRATPVQSKLPPPKELAASAS